MEAIENTEPIEEFPSVDLSSLSNEEKRLLTDRDALLEEYAALEAQLLEMEKEFEELEKDIVVGHDATRDEVVSLNNLLTSDLFKSAEGHNGTVVRLEREIERLENIQASLPTSVSDEESLERFRASVKEAMLQAGDIEGGPFEELRKALEEADTFLTSKPIIDA